MKNRYALVFFTFSVLFAEPKTVINVQAGATVVYAETGSSILNVGPGGHPSKLDVTTGNSAITTEIQAALKNETDQKTDQETQQSPHLLSSHAIEQQFNGNLPTLDNHNNNKTPAPFWTPKTIFITGTVIAAGTYCYCWLMLYKTRRMLSSKESWSNWKHEIALEDLMTLPRIKLAEELLTTIQAKHVNTANPADHVYPMTQFIEAVNRESALLRSYLWFLEKTKRFNVLRIFPEKNLGSIAQDRLHRLAYLKTVFFDWAYSYRSKQAKPLVSTLATQS